MKKLFGYICTGVAAAMLVSCNLDLTPTTSIAYDENGQLIQSEANLNAFRAGMFASYRSYQLGEFTTAEEVMTDGFNATLDYGNNYGGLHKTDYNFTAGDYYVADYWNYSYVGIKDYNILIANTENVPEQIKDAARAVQGEAYFLRAATYLNLARHFAKIPSTVNAEDRDKELCVPLVLVYDQLEKPARASVAAVYGQIKKDLDSAAVRLSDVTGKAGAMYPTIDAVNALYARYFLDMGEYGKAAEYAHLVIDTGAYVLSSTAKEMENEFEFDNGREAIYQLSATLTESTNSNTFWTGYTTDTQHEYVFRPYFIPTKTLVDLYEPGDLRLAQWFDNTTWCLVNATYSQGDYYVFKKYWGNPNLTSSLKNGRQAPKPFTISEMFLIAAEAYLAAGEAGKAKDDLNNLQVMRGASATDATEEAIRNEWFKEKVGEGFRMSCLKRWKKGFSSRPVQPGAAKVLNHGDVYDQKELPADDYHWQWPIPADERKINKNLVQNAGYDEL
ncbi:MAG: RagB/SusD family nutrient uptake outer membrane protein [Bacteroidales bacterium]|nr:RagB/SusD family nutrient uptake outer membrane protein [Bacteroidales bacterium]